VTFTVTPGESQSFIWDGSAWGPTDIGITAIPVVVTQGGTGRATGTAAYALVATGTTATGAQQSCAVGATTEILVGGGASALPVWTTATGTGAPVRATSPALVTPNIGAATATSVTFADGGVNIWDIAPASNNGYSGQQESVTAGATVALRDVLYEAADGEWGLADADSTATMPGLRMAVGAGTDGAAVNTIMKGVVRNDSWTWTPGLPIYVSTTGTTTNTLTQTAPSGELDVIQIVGYALTATVMYFDPSPIMEEVGLDTEDVGAATPTTITMAELSAVPKCFIADHSSDQTFALDAITAADVGKEFTLCKKGTGAGKIILDVDAGTTIVCANGASSAGGTATSEASKYQFAHFKIITSALLYMISGDGTFTLA
jgi:hypothetical protein